MRSSIVLVLLCVGCVQQDLAGRPLAPGPNHMLAPEDLSNRASPREGSDYAGPPQFQPQEAAEGIDYSGPPLAQPTPPALSAMAQLNIFPPQVTSISAVRQVTVAFELVGAGFPNVASVEFVNPAGEPYERQEVAIEGSAFVARRLEFVLPVAATAIDTGRMSGVWTARLMIDGRSMRDQTFELTP